jgi:cell division protein FtsQ
MNWPLVAMILAGLSGAGGLYWYANRVLPGHWQALCSAQSRLECAVGFRVDRLLIEGRNRLSQDQLRQVLGIQRHDPILRISLEEVVQRLSALPWVQGVVAERRLPNTLYIRLKERVPVALWQDKGQLFLVDRQGVLMQRTQRDHFPSLIIVTGKKAHEHAPNLLRILAGHPVISKRVSGALFISQRRWDLVLDGALRVKLPESEIPYALRQLEKLAQEGKLNPQVVRTLDLRQVDRMYITLTPEALEKKELKKKAALTSKKA